MVSWTMQDTEQERRVQAYEVKCNSIAPAEEQQIAAMSVDWQVCYSYLNRRLGRKPTEVEVDRELARLWAWG